MVAERSRQMALVAESGRQRDLAQRQVRAAKEARRMLHASKPLVVAGGAAEVTPERPGEVNRVHADACRDLADSEAVGVPVIEQFECPREPGRRGFRSVAVPQAAEEFQTQGFDRQAAFLPRTRPRDARHRCVLNGPVQVQRRVLKCARQIFTLSGGRRQRDRQDTTATALEMVAMRRCRRVVHEYRASLGRRSTRSRRQ